MARPRPLLLLHRAACGKKTLGRRGQDGPAKGSPPLPSRPTQAAIRDRPGLRRAVAGAGRAPGASRAWPTRSARRLPSCRGTRAPLDGRGRTRPLVPACTLLSAGEAKHARTLPGGGGARRRTHVVPARQPPLHVCELRQRAGRADDLEALGALAQVEEHELGRGGASLHDAACRHADRGGVDGEKRARSEASAARARDHRTRAEDGGPNRSRKRMR